MEVPDASAGSTLTKSAGPPPAAAAIRWPGGAPVRSASPV